MWKSTELRDDIPMPSPAGNASFDIGVPLARLFRNNLMQEADTAILFLDGFRVMDRMIQPNARHGMQFAIQTVLNSRAHDFESPRVAQISFGRIAVEISRELI